MTKPSPLIALHPKASTHPTCMMAWLFGLIPMLSLPMPHSVALQFPILIDSVHLVCLHLMLAGMRPAALAPHSQIGIGALASSNHRRSLATSVLKPVRGGAPSEGSAARRVRTVLILKALQTPRAWPALKESLHAKPGAQRTHVQSGVSVLLRPRKKTVDLRHLIQGCRILPRAEAAIC